MATILPLFSYPSMQEASVSMIRMKMLWNIFASHFDQFQRMRYTKMEKLFIYAILYSVGYDVWKMYEAELDKLFLDDIENDEYLTLEGMSPKEAVLHTFSLMQMQPINHNVFGKELMIAIKPIYESCDIRDFGNRMHKLWQRLPNSIEYGEDPFFVFCYADDCLSYGDEKQCRDLYEGALAYYDEMIL